MNNRTNNRMNNRMNNKLTFTPAVDSLSLSQDLLRQGGLIMKGVVLCTKCRKKMNKGVCECGNHKCLVRIYWNSTHYEYRRDNDGDVFTYDKALKKLIDISSAIKTGTFNPYYFMDSAISARKFEKQFEDYLTERKQDLDNNEISHEHYRHIESYWKNYYGFFESWDISEITTELLSAFKTSLIKKGIKTKTQKNILNILHNFFVWLKRRGVIKDIPAFPEIRNTDKTRKSALTRDEQLNAISNIPESYRDPILFAMNTGIRPGELVAILIKSVDIKRRFVWIERAKSGPYFVERTKNKESLPVPLNDTALEIVIRNMKGKFPNDFLFINPKTEKPYTQWFLWNVWKQFSQTDVTLYESTRHSFCTQIVPVTDRFTAQRLVRHKDSRSTDNYYHAYSETLLNAVRKIDNVYDIEIVRNKKQEKQP